MNVVSNLDSFARGTCQNQLFVSNLVNHLALVSWASVMSTFGRGCISRITLSFKGFRSTHMRIEPDGFGTITMAAHH